MLNLDDAKMLGLVERAFEAAPCGGRWQQAIARAWREIRENPYMHWTGRSLLTLSPSGEIYVAGRRCQCKSYLFRRPCWHRAAARLLELYFGESPLETHHHV